MNYVNYKNLPKIGDIVGFDLETYDDNGLLKNPYSFEKVNVYFIEKSIHNNERHIDEVNYNSSLLETYEQMRNEDGVSEKDLKKLKKRLDETAQITKVYYSDSKLVMSTKGILWEENSKLNKIKNLKYKDKELSGKFLFLWKPLGMREGQHLIRWEWKSTKEGKLKIAEKFFNLYPSADKVTSLYSKFVPREKYEFLMDKYIPKMYRIKTSTKDITPEVMVKLNRAIAQAFLEFDDLAVGLSDLLDPNFIPSDFLSLMANFFNVELKSSSVTAWRSQIRHSIPLFKKKGTFNGLKEALDKSGIRLNNLKNLWQVVSPYTWTDGFVIDKDIGVNKEIIGYLTRKPKDNNIELHLRSSESNKYFVLDKKFIELQETFVPENRIAVIWNGGNDSDAIELFKGDGIKIKYFYNKIPDDAVSLEGYINSLPLADKRDETKVKYPLKNWNVRLIEEDDPFFKLLITERHPFSNPIVYGKVRTTFLYSEKAFNMDTFNGSLYNSNNPCDMDKDFIDNCSSGQSSKFNIEVEVDTVTNDKIKYIKEIVTDYSPFHAVLNNIKVNSRITDLVLPPEESIKTKIGKSKGDKVECQENVFCKVKYKDGRTFEGRLI